MKISRIFKVVGSSLIIFTVLSDNSLAGTITDVANAFIRIPPDKPGGITVYLFRSPAGEGLINITPGTPPSIQVSKKFTAIDFIDIQFKVLDERPATPVTRHFIGIRNPNNNLISSGDFVLNRTNNNWTDYHFQVGFGIGGNFRLSGEGDNLDLGTGNPGPPSNASNTVFTRGRFLNQGNELFWDQGLVPIGGKVGFGIAIDTPNSNTIPAQARLSDGNGYIFTLRQFPTCDRPSPRRNSQNTATCSIPEPASTLSLLALGTLSAGSVLKRKLKPFKSTKKELEKVS